MLYFIINPISDIIINAQKNFKKYEIQKYLTNN